MSGPGMHRILLAVVVVLLAACTMAGCGRAHPLQWGVFVPDDGSPSSDLATVAIMAGDEPDYVLRFAALDEPVPIEQLTAIAEGGRTPMLTLEPWVPGAGVDQPDYALARIAQGAHDEALQRWATALAAWGRPLLLRFAHEMNGTWYPWAVGVNGNTASDYLAAWDHVSDAFESAGADQVALVWAPNVGFEGASPLEDAYPGETTVDYLGLDGYNWGDGDGYSWQDPVELFADSLDRLGRLPGDLPILVTEVASAEGPVLGADKAEWISDFVEHLSRSDRVIGFVWFQAVKERDWRFNSTAQAEAAMKQALASLPS